MTTFAILDVNRTEEVLSNLKPLADYGKVLFFGENEKEAMWDALPEVDIALIRLYPIDKPFLDRAENLKAVIKAGVGVDHIDVSYATKRGVHVAISPGNHISVAETAILLMLAVARELPQKNKNTNPTANMLGIELYGKTLGLVGAGRIGGHVARIARDGLGMRVLVYDPYLSEEAKKGEQWEPVDIDTLTTESDVISIHCPVTPETYHLFDMSRLLKMKNRAILVNTARGSIIDEQALFTVLKQGHLAGVGLDVVEQEPLTSGNPLIGLSNVIVTPHRLAQTPESIIRQAQSMYQSAVKFANGGVPDESINRKEILLSSGP